MADMNIVLEGSLKHRDGRKWKSRWCVVRKLSPVADRLHISLYKDAGDFYQSSPEKAMLSLEEFLGIESCFSLAGEGHVMAIVCLNEVTLLAFQGREMLIQWEIRIRSHLGEENQYPARLVKTPPNNKLTLGPVKLYIQGGRIGLTTGTPPVLTGSWNIADLRKYGVVDKKFCFEAGSRCGKVSGLYVLQTEQSPEINERISQASQSKNTKSRRSSSSSTKRRSQLSCHSVMSNMSSISSLSGVSGLSSPPPEVFAKDFQDTEVYADLNFMSEPSPMTGSSVETTSTIFSDSSSDCSSETRHKLVSIENLLTPGQTHGIYDTPPRGVRPTTSSSGGNNLNNDLTLRQNELEDTNTLPRLGSRDELNISPELDDVDGCGMIVDASRSAVAGSMEHRGHIVETGLGNSQSYTNADTTGASSFTTPGAAMSTDLTSSIQQPRHLTLLTSPSSGTDMDLFMSTVQRNVDVLSPKLPKCEQNKVVTTGFNGDTGADNGATGTCVFESHGQMREPDMETLDLLDEVLRACNVDAFSSSSGGHSSRGSKGDLGVHSIHSSTCSIGSANNPITEAALSEGSTHTSPAQTASMRTSPARNDSPHTGPSPTGQIVNRSGPSPTAHLVSGASPGQQKPGETVSLSSVPPAPSSSTNYSRIPDNQPPPDSSMPLTAGVQVLPIKCRHHDYVNVSGVGSALINNILQEQQQQPRLSSFATVPSSSTTVRQNTTGTFRTFSQQHSAQAHNSDYHDYVNISPMNGNTAPAPSLTTHHQQHAVRHTDANSNPSVTVGDHRGDVVIDANQPLPYMNLGCYDNEDEGYLYWVKGTVEKREAPVILSQPQSKAAILPTAGPESQAATSISRPETHQYYNVVSDNKASYNQYDNDHQEYVNAPAASGARSVMAKLSAVRGKLLAYHDSLRRSKKPPACRNNVEDNSERLPHTSSSAKNSPRSSPKHSPKGSPKRSPRSSPKSVRNSLRTALFRSRGKSLEDILDATLSEAPQAASGSVHPPDLFGLPPPGPPRKSRICCSPSQMEGEYVQLNMDERVANNRPTVQNGNRRPLPELSRTPAPVDEVAYIVMSGSGEASGGSRTMLSSSSSQYNSHSDMESPGSSMQSSYGSGTTAAGTTVLCQSPSPICSPHSLHHTPPSVGAISPHGSPKKQRAVSSSSAAADHSDYMFMSGQLREEEDNAVFCAMELPLRSGSVSSHATSMRSRNCSFSSATSSDTHTTMNNSDENYLSMSMGRQRSNSSQAFRPVTHRPPLNQSRSLDTDYDSQYLPMNLLPPAGGGASVAARTIGGAAHHSDYMCMTPGRDDAPAGRTPIRPFEDLIEHEPYVTKKPILPPMLTRKSSSDAARGDEIVKSPPPSGKKDRFLSRLIRRNSSKERRGSTQSKSQEDILRSPIAETLSEVPIAEPHTLSPYNPATQDPFGLVSSNSRGRRASEDALVPPPLTCRMRSASYSHNNRPVWTETGNLTDEQKQCQKSNGSLNSSGQDGEGPPTLPPRTYRKSKGSGPSVLYPVRKKAIPAPLQSHYMLHHDALQPRIEDSPPHCDSPDLDFLDRPVSPNMPTEAPPPPPPVSAYSHGSETTLCTDSNPNSTNTSTLTLLHISEDDDRHSTPPPELPEKTHRRRSSPGSVLSAPFSLLRRQTARRCPSPTWQSSELLLTEQEQNRVSSNCTSPTIPPRTGWEGHLVVHIPSSSEDNDEVMWSGHSNGGSIVSTPTSREDGRPPSRARVKTDSSETQSISSYGSADTTSTRSDEHKASPASTTLRPRFGKEYKKLDRRKLADDLSAGGGSSGGGYQYGYSDGQRTPGSPSVASSVFTFDTTSLSSRVSSLSGHSGYGNESPRSPLQHYSTSGPPRSPAVTNNSGPHTPGPLSAGPFPLSAVPHRIPHDYINVCMPRTDSPHRFWDMTPPGSPRSISGASEQSNPMLNYAEIDLTLAEERAPRKPLQKNDIEYAMIDMVATAAASRAGKEHAQLREDSLRRKDGRRGEDGSQEYIRRSKIERKNSQGGGSRSERKPASRSGSKDRKVSAPN